MAYPRTLYHPVLPPQIVANISEENALGALWLPDPPAKDAICRVGVALSAENDASYPIAVRSADRMTYYVVWSPGCTAGEIVCESVHDPAFVGRWSGLASVPQPGVSVVPNSADYIAVQGLHGAHRCRVAQAVQGGTADIYWMRL